MSSLGSISSVTSPGKSTHGRGRALDISAGGLWGEGGVAVAGIGPILEGKKRIEVDFDAPPVNGN